MADESLQRGAIIKQLPESKSSNPTQYKSVATMTDAEIAASASGMSDPLRAMVGIVNEDQLIGYQRSVLDDHLDGLATGRRPAQMKMTGTVDPVIASIGFAIGDRVYHKLRKKEGKVDDVAAKSGVHVKFDDGGRGWQKPENLVKL